MQLNIYKVYEIGFGISAGITIVGAMVAVFLFFFLDIRQVIRMSSGKQRRKRIQEKAVQYSSPDTSSDLSIGHTPQYIAISEEITAGKHKKGKKAEKLSSTSELPVNTDMGYSTSVTQTEENPTSVTSVLKRGNAVNMTTVLQEPGRQNPTIAPNKRFEVIQNIMIIHTTEKI